MCDCNIIGDEFRYILEFAHFANDTKKIKKFLSKRYLNLKTPNTCKIKFNELMNTCTKCCRKTKKIVKIY